MQGPRFPMMVALLSLVGGGCPPHEPVLAANIMIVRANIKCAVIMSPVHHAAISFHAALAPPMSCSSAAQAGAEYEHLVARLIATPATRLALPNATSAERASLVQKAFEDSVVRTHFSDHCVFVSCDSTASTEVTTACIASGLGLEPSEHAIVNVLEEIAAHDRTLIVLDNVDAIYLPTDTEQQEATNVLLATLASVDGLTLVITFCGIPLPECVAWTSTDNSTNDRLKPGSHATNLAQHLSTPAAVSCSFNTTHLGTMLIALRLHLLRFILRKPITFCQPLRPPIVQSPTMSLFLLPLPPQS